MMARSYLYVPGDAPGLESALDRGADALVVDLESGVASDAKESARKTVAAWLPTVPAGLDIWVRINPGPLGLDDAREVVGPRLRGLCVARTESPVQLDTLDTVLSTVEAEAGLPARSVAVVPLLESAAAVLGALAIARAPRVERLQLGEAGLRSDLRVDPSDDERELLWARSHVVLASAAVGLDPPVASASTDVTDVDRLRASTLALRRLGYRARACVHPTQVAIVNDVFS